MRFFTRYSLSALIVLLCTACSQHLTPITTCEKAGNLEPICRFTNPEDIELLPDGKTLLISQMGNMEGSKPGNLVAFNTDTQIITPLFPLATITGNATGENWGSKNCPGLPDNHFAPHGISLKQRDDGRWQLAVINHGHRETLLGQSLLDRSQFGWAQICFEKLLITIDVALMRTQARSFLVH